MKISIPPSYVGQGWNGRPYPRDGGRLPPPRPSSAGSGAGLGRAERGYRKEKQGGIYRPTNSRRRPSPSSLSWLTTRWRFDVCREHTCLSSLTYHMNDITSILLAGLWLSWGARLADASRGKRAARGRTRKAWVPCLAPSRPPAGNKSMGRGQCSATGQPRIGRP